MKSSSFSKIMLLGSLLFGVLFSYILIFTNPEKGNWNVWFFIISLFLFVFCTYSLISFIVKRKLSNNEIHHIYLKSSIREGFLLGLLFLGLLGLGVVDLLTWWDGVLLALTLILVEMYFKSGRSRTND